MQVLFQCDFISKCDFEGRGFPESQLMMESISELFIFFLFLLMNISLIEFDFSPHPPPSVNTEKEALICFLR